MSSVPYRLPKKEMPVRRTHVKSRYGCTQCKSRKLKCDEVKPCCKNCTKRDLPCSLNTTGPSIIFLPGLKEKSPNSPTQRLPAAVPDLSSAAGRSHSVDSLSPGYNRLRAGSLDNPFSRRPSDAGSSAGFSFPDSSTFTQAERSNMDLILHFTRSTWRILPGGTTEGERSHLWLDYIYSLGRVHDFVLHSILAVTALHLALTEPSSSSALSSQAQALALHHHTAALGLSRPHFDSVQTNMVPPLFAFSILMSIYAFGHPKVSPHIVQPVLAIQEILGLLRGCGTVARSGENMLESGPIASLRLPQRLDAHAPLAPDLERALGGLAARNAESTVDEEMRAIYEEAIRVLWYTFVLIQDLPEIQMTTVPFAIAVSAEVLQKMREEQPMALLILAHYAVMLHYLDESPWMKGWGRWVVEGVGRKMGQEWRGSLEWATAEVRKPGMWSIHEGVSSM